MNMFIFYKVLFCFYDIMLYILNFCLQNVKLFQNFTKNVVSIR